MKKQKAREAVSQEKTYNIYYKGTYIGYVRAVAEDEAYDRAIMKVIISNGQCDRADVRVERSFF